MAQITGRCAFFGKLLVLGVFVLTGAQILLGQGMLISSDPTPQRPLPRPGRPSSDAWSYRIKSLRLQSRVTGQRAETELTQTFVNTGTGTIEASFVFPLPYDGAIDRMTFLVDGKEYTAQLLAADEARGIYESHVRKSQDPALLEWVGRGMFRTSVFPIPPGASRSVSLRFTQLLTKEDRLIDYRFLLATAKYSSSPIEEFSLRLAVNGERPLKNIYSPTHEVQIQRNGDRDAIVTFEAKDHVPKTDFRLLFDGSDTEVGASVVSYWPQGEDSGYFVLLASPHPRSSETRAIAKSLFLVLDRSGSMSGEKFTQAITAARQIVERLGEQDLFNIIVYDSTVEPFRPELQRATAEGKSAAIRFLDGLFSGGGTNIDEALKTTFAQVPAGDLPCYIVFLTDGLPTEGETGELQIAAKSKELNIHHARMLNLGVGYDVNSRLLDRLAREHRGQAIYVGPQENLETTLGRLYGKIAQPVMTDVAFQFVARGSGAAGSLTRVYPAGPQDLFAGQQLVVVGRYRDTGPVEVRLTGKVAGETRELKFEGAMASAGSPETNAFTARLWALRRIAEITDQIDLNGRNEELVQELVALAKKHGIVTPYTSYLADENAPLASVLNGEAGRRFAEDRLSRLADSAGADAFYLRMAKQESVMAPTVGPGIRTHAVAPSGDRLGREVLGGEGESDKSAGLEIISDQPIFIRDNEVVAENASDVDLEKDAAEIRTIKRYSDDYFELVRANSTEENAILARQVGDVYLLIRLRGTIYRIEP